MNDEGEVNISRLKHKSVPSFPKPPGFGNPLKEKNMYKQMNKKEIQPPSPHLEGFFYYTQIRPLLIHNRFLSDAQFHPISPRTYVSRVLPVTSVN